MDLIEPNREPDFKVGHACFWWEEKINGCDGYYFYINPEEGTYFSRGNWRNFSSDFMREHGNEYRASYAQWLLEKELKR